MDKVIGQKGTYSLVASRSSSLLEDISIASDNEYGRQVLIHVFFPEISVSRKFRESFLSLGKKLAELDHPDLVRVIDYGIVDQHAFLVTEMVQAQPLSEKLDEPQTFSCAARTLLPVARGLEYLHALNIVHGNLTPECIWVAQDGGSKLSGYGVYDLLRAENQKTAPEEMIGLGLMHPEYLAPEQIVGKEASPQGDIFSLGLIFYRLIFKAGRFQGMNELQTALLQTKTPLTFSGGMWFKVPRSTFKFIKKACAIHPKDRFHTVEEMIPFLEKAGAEPPRNHATHIFQKNLSTRSRRIAIAGTSLFILFLLLIGYQFNRVGSRVTGTETPTPVLYVGSPTPSLVAQPAAPGEKPKSSPTHAPTIPEPSASPTPFHGSVLEGTPFPDNLNMISPGNANKIQEIARLGMGKFNQVAWSPDGAQLALATTAGVFLLDVVDLHIQEFINTGGSATSIRYSIDGKSLAIGMSDGQIKIWNLDPIQELLNLNGHESQVTWMIFAQNGRFLFSSSYDHTIRIWDYQSGELFKTITAHSMPIYEFDISTDSRFLVTGSIDGKVKLWDIASSQVLHEVTVPTRVWTVALSPDQEYFAASGEDGLIREWFVSTGNYRKSPRSAGVGGGVTSLIYNNSGTSLSYASINSRNSYCTYYSKFCGPVNPDTGYARQLAVSSDEENSVLLSWDGQLNLKGTSREVRFDFWNILQQSTKGSYLAASGPFFGTKVWKVPENTLVSDPSGKIYPGDIFSPDEAYWLGYDVSHAAAYYRINGNRAVISTLPDEMIGGYLRDGKIAILSSLNETHIWDTTMKLELSHQDGRYAGCRKVYRRDNQELIALVSRIHIFEETSPSIEWYCKIIEREDINLPEISPEHRFLVYVNLKGLIELWNMDEERQVWRVQPEQPVTSFSFSPDEKIIAAASEDGHITLLDTDNGQILHSFQAHPDRINTLKFSLDGRWIGSASDDGTVRIWSVLQ